MISSQHEHFSERTRREEYSWRFSRFREWRNGLTAGISFRKDAKPLQTPPKKKTCGYERTTRKPNPQSTKSSKPKFLLKQMTNTSKMDESHSYQIPPNPILAQANSNQNQRWRNPRIRQPNNFNSPYWSLSLSLLILPQPPTKTHNATINEM